MKSEPLLPPAPGLSRALEPSSFRIMITDDQESMRTMLRKTLKREGYRLEQAVDGVELLEKGRLDPPDLIILDVMMPRMDGLTALREMRRDPALASVYVILVTGRTSLEDKLRGFESGADDYLTKPYSLEELKARVRTGLRLRATERHLERTQEMVVRQEKLATIGVLAAGLAHEFNNIMGGIAGYAQLASRNASFHERLVEVALEQARRAQQITSSLSTFAAGAASSRERTEFGPLVENALCLLKKELSRREIEIDVEIAEQLPGLLINPGQIQEALVHLLLNGMQAAGRGGRIQVRVRRSRSALHLEVDDSGPGVPEDVRHRIFDPFFTTKGAIGTSEEPGMGLGLTFCLNIIQGHRGALHLAPSRLGGACFRAELPITVGELEAQAPEESESPAVPSPAADDAGAVKDKGIGARPWVLVEDDPAIQEIVKELLSGSPPVVFDSGPEAVDHCRENPISGVLLDLTLRGPWNGLRVLKELAAFATPPPVVLTSGTLDLRDEQEIDYPRLKVLPKPFTLTELEEALELAGGLREAPAEPEPA